MPFYRSLNHWSDATRGVALSIGNFDGVHVGHQALIRQVVAQSKAKQLVPTVMMFKPHPKDYFSGQPLPRVFQLRDKLLTLPQYGIQRVLLMSFDQALAQVSARDFVQSILVEHLNVKALVVGDDFRFGYQRQGDLSLLMAMGKQYGFEVTVVSNVSSNQTRVSSSLIRQQLQHGDFKLVSELLGRPYTLSGRVVYGQQLGRAWGFPTLNLKCRYDLALRGIFAVKVHGLDQVYSGAAYVGTRPTLGGKQCVLEVHLLNFNNDCYKRHVAVEFVKKLRSDISFQNETALREQIALDIKATEDYFNTTRTSMHE